MRERYESSVLKIKYARYVCRYVWQQVQQRQVGIASEFRAGMDTNEATRSLPREGKEYQKKRNGERNWITILQLGVPEHQKGDT